MCEIFPEVDNFCMCCSVRVGLLFISILSISTGSVVLNVVMKATKISFEKTMTAALETKKSAENATKITDTADAVKKNSYDLALSVAIIMGVLFIICGCILLFANLIDEEGLVQIFVWVTFLNIVVGFIGLLALSVQCVTSQCALSHMDWLSASFVIIFAAVYLFLWIYFISVANTYVLNKAG